MAKTIPNEEKVFMVSKSTNTTYSGSASLKAMQEWYTMEDVANTVKPYKVFTALLTQSGGSSESYLTEGPLVIGITYLIGDGDGGDDFTNVGAPNSNNGTSFIATGTTPANWTHNAILYYNTGAPVATVLENTIGNIWFTYNTFGNYTINSNDLFIATKTVSQNSQAACFNVGGDSFYNLIIQRQTTNEVELATISDSFETIDNQLTNKMIEIRVYN